MTQMTKSEVHAISAAGVVLPLTPGSGCKLVAGTTYFFEVASPDSITQSIHLFWDANIILTSIWFEASNLNRFLTEIAPDSGADASDLSVTPGQWLEWNPTTGAYISIASTDGSTGGATVTGSQIVVAGGTSGGAIIVPGNINGIMPFKRGRIKVVVGATGGFFRCHPHGKA